MKSTTLLPLLVSAVAAKDCRPPVESEKLQELLTSEGLMANLQAFQDIADANGGNRAFGLPGYTKSVEYVVGELSKLPGFNVWAEDFPAMFALTQAQKVEVDGEALRAVALTFTPSTEGGEITREIVHGPIGAAACDVANYAGIDAEGKIVLVERGLCPDGTTFAGKLKPAAAAGADAVLIYNNGPAQLTGGSLSNPSPLYAPGVIIDQAPAQAIKARLDAGETVEATVEITQLIEERVTQNVYAETKGGDETNLLVLGAHLDSVQAGPGINDDGSGSTLILELAKALQHFSTTLKVRFGWWGAEENGLWGSKYYVNTMNETEVDNLLAYMNFDMVSRGYYGVFDGTGDKVAPGAAPGSEVIEELLTEALEGQGHTITNVGLTGGTDYVAFKDVINKPVGGLFTGTGLAEDPCYHQACDTIDNPNPEVLFNNAKAAAHALAVLAIDGAKLIPKSNSTSAVVRRIVDTASLYERDYVGGPPGKLCDHDII